MRTFEDKAAARERVPLLIGLMGPSGGGKTFSALRLATGIQRVSGGEIMVIDTEARRALHYAPTADEKPEPARGKFRFRHVPFEAPFGSLDYLAAIEHCVSKGAGVIVIDSLSHEHEGQGGLLDQHDQECERLMTQWKTTREKVQMGAWAKPKAARERLKQRMLQVPVNFILCFRAKEKLKISKGKEPEKLGFMPIAGMDFVFEMAMCALLMPNAGGIPTWDPEETGEKMMTKLPEQFANILEGHKRPLDEETGEAMARWAAGGAVVTPSDEECAAVVVGAKNARAAEDLEAVAESARGKPWSKLQRKAIADAVKTRRAELGGAS